MGSNAATSSATSNCGIDLNALAVLGTVGAGATRTNDCPGRAPELGYAFGKIHIERR
jgi:hypothetical protein